MTISLNDYQQAARETAVYRKKKNMGPTLFLLYAGLGLAGESGEVAENLKKMIRDDSGELTPERRESIIKELGDALWYLAMTAEEVGVDLELVAAVNLEKLVDRKERGTLHGDGDDR